MEAVLSGVISREAAACRPTSSSSNARSGSMISNQEWDRYTEKQKFDYLFDHRIRTERAVAQLSAAVDDLRQRIDRLETPPAGTAE